MSAPARPAGAEGLPAYALFAALLSAAGLPLYIHAPKFYVDEYGVSLAALGAVLFALRLLDVVQDPLLGKLAERLRRHRGLSVAIGVGVIVVGMLGLFAAVPPVAPLWWFGAMLTLVFSAYSFLTISFYAQGVQKADTIGRPDPGAGQRRAQGHLRLARWRETGALSGVCVAAIAPSALLSVSQAPFALFALGFAALGLAAVLAMRGEWGARPAPPSPGFGPVMRDPLARRLLLIALVNAAPVAISSTLFLFFVESRLAAPGYEGPLLLVFFLSAALAAPLWARGAERFGARAALLVAMGQAIVVFAFALMLGAGDVLAFGLVCLLSGGALGADLTLLPALFAARMARISPNAAEGFALWSFVSKFSLAIAAIALLPLLDSAGFTAGAANQDSALWVLSLLYAGVPCLLKLVAAALLVFTRLEDAG